MFGDEKDLFASNPGDAFASSANNTGYSNNVSGGFGSPGCGSTGFEASTGSPGYGSAFSTHIDGAAGYGAPPSYGGNQGSVSDYGDRNNHYQNGYGGYSTVLDTATNPKDIMNQV